MCKIVKIFLINFMFYCAYLTLLIVVVVGAIFPEEDKHERILSRRKRYIAFPEGSSLSASLCTTIGFVDNVYDPVDFSYALNWGISYDLPNETWVVQAANGFKNHPTDSKPAMRRRWRRELYNRLELAIESMGYNGRECILKALCESSKYLFGRTGNMIQEILKIVFSLPRSSVKSDEHHDIHSYDRAYREAREVNDCSQNYRNCDFSLIEMALGEYSRPPKTTPSTIMEEVNNNWFQ